MSGYMVTAYGPVGKIYATARLGDVTLHGDGAKVFDTRAEADVWCRACEHYFERIGQGTLSGWVVSRADAAE